ncbi:hypothetical protein NDU88_003840 [Pleurodeles waltl]|uniref:Uncharacterized protein n=1 Tax=Pleurodeles waltl TaxID=8319 RepID=A0AAV7W5R6_PLEWA|nr:hypothetical protein NDU88_003840 [Pleurodeles waltl]
MSTPSRRLGDNSVLPRHVIPTTLSLLIVHYLEEFYLIRISHLFMLTPYLYFDYDQAHYYVSYSPEEVNEINFSETKHMLAVGCCCDDHIWNLSDAMNMYENLAQE